MYPLARRRTCRDERLTGRNLGNDSFVSIGDTQWSPADRLRPLIEPADEGAVDVDVPMTCSGPSTGSLRENLTAGWSPLYIGALRDGDSANVVGFTGILSGITRLDHTRPRTRTCGLT